RNSGTDSRAFPHRRFQSRIFLRSARQRRHRACLRHGKAPHGSLKSHLIPTHSAHSRSMMFYSFRGLSKTCMEHRNRHVRLLASVGRLCKEARGR
ncbi:unnamed protein product, partial [Mycena citricolor]